MYHFLYCPRTVGPTHKLQPLDVAVFRSFKSHYDRVVEHRLRRYVNILVAGYRPYRRPNGQCCIAQAWNKSATIANAVSGFAKARINPHSEADSDDKDYLAADVTVCFMSLLIKL